MIDWFINFTVGLLFLAIFVGAYIKLYDRVRSIVMMFINIPHNTKVFTAEAKKRLAPDNKIPTSKTSRDDKRQGRPLSSD